MAKHSPAAELGKRGREKGQERVDLAMKTVPSRSTLYPAPSGPLYTLGP